MNPKQQVLDEMIKEQGEIGEMVIFFRGGMQMGGRVSQHPSGHAGMYQLAAEVAVGNGIGPRRAGADSDPILAELALRSGLEELREASFVFSIEDVSVMSAIATPMPKRSRRTIEPAGLSPAELESLGLDPDSR